MKMSEVKVEKKSHSNEGILKYSVSCIVQGYTAKESLKDRRREWLIMNGFNYICTQYSSHSIVCG